MLKKLSLAAILSLVLITTSTFAQGPMDNNGGMNRGVNRGMHQMYQRPGQNGNALKADGLNTHQEQQNRQQFNTNRAVRRQQRMEQEQLQSQQNQTQSQTSTVY